MLKIKWDWYIIKINIENTKTLTDWKYKVKHRATCKSEISDVIKEKFKVIKK